MTEIVIDACVALAWCFPDEANGYADAVLEGLERHTMLVPALWPVEITNALLVAERRRRIKASETRQFFALINELPVVMDSRSVTDAVSNLLPLGREYGLSAYDATYLELAMRHGASLATLDSKLQSAARKAGIQIFKAA